MNRAFTRRDLSALSAVLAFAAPAAVLALQRDPAGSARKAMLAAQAKYLDAYNRHDAQAVAAAFHPEAVRSDPANPTGLRGDAILAEAREVFGIYSDVRVQDVKVDPIDDARLVKTFRFCGTWTGRFPNGPLAEKEPSGRSFAMPAVELLAFRDGLIAFSRVYFDRLSLLMQIGAIEA